VVGRDKVDIGDVLVWNDGANFYVKYLVEDSAYSLTETHLQVATAVSGIPQKNGNPIPGKFDLSEEHAGVSEYTYVIPLEWAAGTPVYVAAHGVARTSQGTNCDTFDLDLFASMLPSDPISFKRYLHYPGGPAYFPEIIISSGTWLDGTYYGWCLDTDSSMPNVDYIANVYSSYEPLTDVEIEFPENLDLVNYIINQDWVGQASTCGGLFTYGDVQRAIWTLVENALTLTGLDEWSQCRVDVILADAYANGENYKPGCGDKIAIILEPYPLLYVQILMFEFPIVCVCEVDETAWASGLDFSGSNWAMYFQYDIQ